MQSERQASAFVGCLLGLALGDALGAPFEGGPLERTLWRFIGKTGEGFARWTDDTQMSLDLAESLAACGTLDPDDLAQRFAASYRWSRGYGPGAARILRQIRDGMDWRVANRSAFPEGSFGNGAAMRAPVVGLFCARDLDRVDELARASALITHAHPLGQEAAVLIARATALAINGCDSSEILDALHARAEHPQFRERLDVARTWLHSPLAHPSDVRLRLGNGIAATESCVTALYVALRFLDAPFGDMLSYVATCRGDVDTIGAMAGAIWGSRNGDGALPPAALANLEDADRIRKVALALHNGVPDAAVAERG